jgi:hypothetical protein
MNLCKDCKYVKNSISDMLFFGLNPKTRYMYATCSHPKMVRSGKTSSVNGVTSKDTMFYCNAARVSASLCGEDGTYFEPKK